MYVFSVTYAALKLASIIASMLPAQNFGINVVILQHHFISAHLAGRRRHLAASSNLRQLSLGSAPVTAMFSTVHTCRKAACLLQTVEPRGMSQSIRYHIMRGVKLFSLLVFFCFPYWPVILLLTVRTAGCFLLYLPSSSSGFQLAL